MRRVVLIGLTIVCALAVAAIIAATGLAQQKGSGLGVALGFRGESLTVSPNTQQKAQKQPDNNKKPKPSPLPFPIYNPYPPGILPPDLDSELARVEREVDVIEARAIARWQALPP